MRQVIVLSKIVVAISICIVAFAGLVWFFGPSGVSTYNVTAESVVLPLSVFEISQESYDSIGGRAFSLEDSTFSMRLPDLRCYVIFYGVNKRPDVDPLNPLLHIGLRDVEDIESVNTGDRLFLIYDRSSAPGKYIFSPDNEETDLWIVATHKNNKLEINVKMVGGDGTLVSEPSAFAIFELSAREPFRNSSNIWDVGGYRVDPGLLARQRARWYGKDLFLENHGWEEYPNAVGKQRIDFTEEEDKYYSVYLGDDDCMVWEGARWKTVVPGEESQGLSLMKVKKIDERVMNLELWNPDGQAKIVLNLIRSMEIGPSQNIQKDFRFVGAKTRRQSILEIAGERMLISPQDWLLYVDGGWRKLTTEEDIDDYVAGVLRGELFVFDGVVRKGGRQFLLGRMYNKVRTGLQEIELPVQSTVQPPMLPGTELEKPEKRWGRINPPFIDNRQMNVNKEEDYEGRGDVPLLRLPETVRGEFL